MKHMRKILALALALMLVLGLATTASADNTGYTVTIKNATGHTYKIYQIFTGDLSKNTEGKDVLSNIKYGADYLPDGKTTKDLVSDDELQNVESINPNGTGTEMTTTGDTATVTNLVAGYYMIKDVTTTTTLPDGDTASAVIFQVVGNTEIYSKHTGTTIVKKVQDINDSTGETSDWIDSADYDIDDTVPFQSTATFEGLANYDTYKVVFTDTMAKGLTYDNNMTVTVNGTDKTTDFNITVTDCADVNGAYKDGKVITVTCNNLAALTTGNAATVVLSYSATLNENANIGAAGNPNKIKVSTQADGTGETPEDVNIVFTYKVNVDKFAEKAEAGKELSGAGFTLYKEVPASTNGAQTGATIKAAFAQNIKAAALDNAKYYIVARTATTTNDGKTFGFNGLDDGNYVLVETTVPTGYNAWDAKAFIITAKHDIVAANPTLTELTGGNLLTGEVSTGVLDADIVNNAGTTLPETGGMGTTLFYIIGGVLALAAVVLLVTKKRMASAE